MSLRSSLLSEEPAAAAGEGSLSLQQREGSAASSDGDGGGGAAVASGWLALCMATMGLSAFPICETLLLQVRAPRCPAAAAAAAAPAQTAVAAQTSAFTECFGFDGFYAEACLALFLPGLLIQFLQNRLDHKIDRLTSSSGLVESTAKLNIGRVIVGHLLQLAALLAFLIVLQSDLPHGGALAQRSDHVRYVMLVMFALIGFGSGDTATHFLDSSRCPSR